jgi:hypothetical protein
VRFHAADGASDDKFRTRALGMPGFAPWNSAFVCSAFSRSVCVFAFTFVSRFD